MLPRWLMRTKTPLLDKIIKEKQDIVKHVTKNMSPKAKKSAICLGRSVIYYDEYQIYGRKIPEPFKPTVYIKGWHRAWCGTRDSLPKPGANIQTSMPYFNHKKKEYEKTSLWERIVEVVFRGNKNYPL